MGIEILVVLGRIGSVLDGVAEFLVGAETVKGSYPVQTVQVGRGGRVIGVDTAKRPA